MDIYFFYLLFSYFKYILFLILFFSNGAPFSIVPLQLQCTINNEQKIILWKNLRTSSTRYCRPIKFEIKKETVETTIKEVEIIEEEIKNLIPTVVTINNIEIQVKHTLVFTMVDGKVCIMYTI